MADTPPTLIVVDDLADDKLEELAKRDIHGDQANDAKRVEDLVTHAAGRELKRRRRIAELVELAAGVEGDPRANLIPAESTPDNALTAALAAAQGEFPKIDRGNTAEVRGKDGKAGYSYTYADLGAVLGAVRPILAKHGLAITQHTAHKDGGKVLLVTMLRHVAGGELTTEVEVGQAPSNPQAFGGALTYLRRYELVTLLGIAAEEDRDAQDVPPARGNGRAEPELPAWALEASKERKAAYVKALGPIIGETRTKLLGSSVAQSLGHLPDVVVGFAKALAIVLEEELGDDVKAQFAANRQAQEEAARAQAAAEEPDAPAPDETATERIEAMREEAAEEPDPPEEEPPADDGSPLPGTVDPPEIPEGANLDDVAVTDPLEAAFRAAGCTCKAPLAPVDEKDAHRDDCPLKGHGIPF